MGSVARAFGALAAVLLAFAVMATPAFAADAVSIRAIDTRDFPTVRVSALFAGERPNLADVAVRENGRIVDDVRVVPVSETARPVGIVLVIDTSGSMKAAGKLARAKDAANRFVDGKQPTDQVAIVAFSNQARIVSGFTADAATLQAGIAGLQPAGETALWDAVRLAGSLFADHTEVLPYLVVLSDGADTVSSTTFDQALGATRAAGAGVFPIALTGGGESDVAALRSLAEQTGGDYAETTDASRLAELYGRVQRVLQNQYEISWTSKVVSGNLDVSVKLGAAIATASVAVKGVGVGSVSQPHVVAVPRAPAVLSGGIGLVVLGALVALAAAAFGATVVEYLRRERPSLDIVDAYAGGTQATVATGTDRDLVPESVRRAVEATARLTGGGGLLTQLDQRLDAADLKLKAQEFVLFYAAGVVALTVLGLVAGGPLIGIAALIIGVLFPLAVINQLAERRRTAFTRQLPDALQLLASSLRAGYSLVQGLEAVSDEIEDPMGRELRRAVLETRLGRDLEVSLDDTARRMNSPDFDWVVIAIRIQREVGGNLAELLTSVADTMISRERLRREVSALTAEGRLSMFIVGALPVVIALALYVLNPGYLTPLFTSTIGKGMILGAVGLTFAGFAWMKKVVSIDV